MRIAEMLTEGRANARSGKELAQAIGCNIREITQRIAEERRNGAPICATSDANNPGYYLAETPDDLAAYCERLRRRAGELFKTRRGLLRTLQEIQKAEA